MYSHENPHCCVAFYQFNRIHTGDYLYEYGEWQNWARDSEKRWEMQLPKTEIYTLNDYRLRHATYVSDEGLQNLRRTAPMVATWVRNHPRENLH